MIKREKIRNTRIVGFLLMIFFLFFTINTIFFQHVHRLPSGELVWHTHPFHKTTDNASGAQHQHTSAELAVVAAIGWFLSQSILVCESPSQHVIVNLFIPPIQPLLGKAVVSHIGRSPPYFLS